MLSTCLGHIFVTRESGAIETFSCVATPPSQEGTQVLHCLGVFWAGCVGQSRAVGVLGERNNYFAVLYLHAAISGKGEVWVTLSGSPGSPDFVQLSKPPA